jgi:LPLT family lysophospholipid transporter-like MFS transporter
VSGNLRYIILAWSAAALGYSTTQASSWRRGRHRHRRGRGRRLHAHAAGPATSVMPLGIAMGVLVILMNFINNVWVAAPFLILLGGWAASWWCR